MQRFRKAQGMSVATLKEGAIVGKVDDFQFDLETGRVYGFRLKQGVFARSGGVPAAGVALLGRDLFFVTEEAAVEWSGAARAQTEGRAWGTEYRGTKVMTRRGERLGAVDDYLLEPTTPRVRGIVLDDGRVAVLDDRTSIGRDAVIVDDPTVAVAPPAGADEGSDWWRRVRGMFEGAEK